MTPVHHAMEPERPTLQFSFPPPQIVGRSVGRMCYISIHPRSLPLVTRSGEDGRALFPDPSPLIPPAVLLGPLGRVRRDPRLPQRTRPQAATAAAAAVVVVVALPETVPKVLLLRRRRLGGPSPRLGDAGRPLVLSLDEFVERLGRASCPGLETLARGQRGGPGLGGNVGRDQLFRGRLSASFFGRMGEGKP